MISMVDVSAGFGSFRLRGINLTVKGGEYWVIVGPSGAGKSALLQIVSGFKKGYSGKLLKGEVDLRNVPPEKRNIGFVFQQDVLFPHRTVAGNLRFPLELRKIHKGEIERRVEEYATKMKILPLLGRAIEGLSGGEIQRVAIARSLIFKPEILVLDEPFSALDHNSRIELQEELKALRKEFDFTALHVTHSRDEAFSLASHLAVMRAGEIVQTGTCEAVRGSPASDFVGEFLGLPGQFIA